MEKHVQIKCSLSLQANPYHQIAQNSIKNVSHVKSEEFMKINNFDTSNYVQQFGYVTMYPLAKLILNIT